MASNRLHKHFSTNFGMPSFVLIFIKVRIIIRSSFNGLHADTILLLYMDDMIIHWNNTENVKDLKRPLMYSFKKKDLGHLTYFLGLKISQFNEGICIYQRKYAEDHLGFARRLRKCWHTSWIQMWKIIKMTEIHCLIHPSIAVLSEAFSILLWQGQTSLIQFKLSASLWENLTYLI